MREIWSNYLAGSLISMSAALTCCFTIAPVIQAQDFSSGRWVDLTHAFTEQSIYWPTAETFRKTTVSEGYTEGGYYYSAFKFSAAEHGGTHIDAPVHFAEGRHSVDQIPVQQLVGAAVVIDIKEKARNDRDYQLSVQDVLAWEKEHGRLPSDIILLINTGSSDFYSDRKKYMGTAKRGEEGVSELSFPGIHPEAATFLAQQRKIKAVGLDTPSIDYGRSKKFESHVILYKKNIPGFENVTNIDLLPAKGSIVFALPMKIEGGSGGPLRIVAFIAEK
ncbi:MAG: cyclase family protein [Pseudomonadales bacterium]